MLSTLKKFLATKLTEPSSSDKPSSILLAPVKIMPEKTIGSFERMSPLWFITALIKWVWISFKTFWVSSLCLMFNSENGSNMALFSPAVNKRLSTPYFFNRSEKPNPLNKTPMEPTMLDWLT